MNSIGKTPEDLGPATGPMLGGLIGLGIVFPALPSNRLFCGWGSKLLMIQSGYRVSYAIVMGTIIGGRPS